jgi:hypothetical protein
LIERLLPHNAPGEWAFYAYNMVTGKVSLRTWRMEPGKDGSYKVVSNPGDGQPEQVTTYDAEGKMVERRVGDQVTKPATQTELNAIWKK